MRHLTSHRPRHARRALATISAITVLAVGLAVTAFILAGRSTGPTFPTLVPASAPVRWPHATLPDGTAVLSYPPSLHRVAGDSDAVSAGRTGPGGNLQIYLNATPRQGSERLPHWATFRLDRLRSDDAIAAHQVAAGQHVKFRGGVGSCVIDRYVTRIARHRYEEIACLVHGHSSASVIVAAAPTATWAQARPLLFRAVQAYRVR